MQSYLVTMLDRLTGQECKIVVQSECGHGMQQFVDDLASKGQLSIACPVVIDVDERAARHVPIVERAVD
ncbi:hypothetical protein [Mycolicibacter kumamotonensis]|uniref:Uncharacterized protein n=1 Tax=Mycolicibacter kumamotonensis TaxID=354243 RepID=A0A1B8SLB1_9MYCO|nr:hypothetical protein [Mycolicibacter kumamotonensis]OBY33529.1 hypothetical protein ACT18_00940 [Mycolicibacter kumamotonensis]